MVAQPNYRPTMLHVRDAPRSASDVGYIMRILRILFALGARSLPPSPSWGLRCALCARDDATNYIINTRTLSRLASCRDPFSPRLSSLIVFFPLDCDSRCNSVGWQFKSNQSARHGRRAAGVSPCRGLGDLKEGISVFRGLSCPLLRPTDRPRPQWSGGGPYVQGSSPPPPRRGRCAPL